jgi:hypothetical protein
MSKNGMCKPCGGKDRRHEGGQPCAECGIEPTTRPDGICYGCMLAIKDDTGVRGIAESQYDLDDLGTWRIDPVRRVQVFVPTPPPPPEPEPPWPDPWDDSEASAGRRMEALIADVKSTKTRPRKVA